MSMSDSDSIYDSLAKKIENLYIKYFVFFSPTIQKQGSFG